LIAVDRSEHVEPNEVWHSRHAVMGSATSISDSSALTLSIKREWSAALNQTLRCIAAHDGKSTYRIFREQH
jgi:hypothetical protein